jgi:hypothetical protein
MACCTSLTTGAQILQVRTRAPRRCSWLCGRPGFGVVVCRGWPSGACIGGDIAWWRPPPSPTRLWLFLFKLAPMCEVLRSWAEPLLCLSSSLTIFFLLSVGTNGRTSAGEQLVNQISTRTRAATKPAVIETNDIGYISPTEIEV